jgi:hypothetical protein
MTGVENDCNISIAKFIILRAVFWSWFDGYSTYIVVQRNVFPEPIDKMGVRN